MTRRERAVRRYREQKLRRAKLRLADLEYNLKKWGFANTPSQDDRERRQIEKQEAIVARMIERMGGDSDDDPA